MRVEDKYLQNFDQISNLKKATTDNAKSKGGSKERSSSVAKSEVSSLIDRVKSAPEIRKDKVDQIRNQIEAGTYNVAGKKVAEKIVGTAIDNLF